VILGVTPARGGSKGVPRKNIRLVSGKPLLTWTVEAARSSKLLDRYVVSTEDAEIAEVARAAGAEVAERPPELATDDASTLAVVRHTVGLIDADIVVVLQPTSPIRRPGLVDLCVGHFAATGADSLGTVHRDYSYEYGATMPRRQEIRPRLVDNGNVYVLSATLVRAGRWIGEHPQTFEITREEGVEIDDEFDLWLAQQILAHRWPAT